MLQKIEETVTYLRKQVKELYPETGIILGTGLGDLVNEIEISHSINYTDIPNFPVSTVESHQGELIFGKLNGKSVVAMQGRFHYYEGYSMQEVTFPVRVMKKLGVGKLYISNASGSVNPQYEVSDLMIIRDHINLLPENPLRGPNIDELGLRFPDMSDPYDRELIDQAVEIARSNTIKCHVGVYAAVQGPMLETPAEYKYIATIGADVVGMSTIPEVIAARHMGLSCFAISVVTDLGVPGRIEKVTVEKVISAAKKAEPGMTKIMKELIGIS